MAPLNTIEGLDSFLNGVALLASLHSKERFWFSAVTLPRGQTPLETLLAAHNTLVRPHASMLEGRTPQLNPLDRTAFDDILGGWLLRHMQSDSPTQRRARVCQLTDDVYDGSEMLLGSIEASYVYRLDPQIYNELRQEIIDQQWILLLGPTSAILIMLAVTPR
jgi:hypothetical protein